MEEKTIEPKKEPKSCLFCEKRHLCDCALFTQLLMLGLSFSEMDKTTTLIATNCKNYEPIF